MQRALELAERGRGQVEPNPLVGAVVVRDGAVVGEGWHVGFGLPHAEVEALRDAGAAARGATVYVTLEPCSHHGKTPPCTDALLAAGVERVVYAVADPNPRAAGGGAVLREAGVAVGSGPGEEGARWQNARFFHAFSSAGAGRPWIELKLALSLDGRLADRDGRSGWITGELARAEVHRIRAGHDAVAVGIGTVLADDPLLTVRGATVPRRTPVRIVFDRNLRTPVSSRLVRSAAEAPLWIVAAPDADPAARHALEGVGARVLMAAELRSALGMLREEGLASILCEGGSAMAAAHVEAGLVDRLTLFYAPVLLGAAGRPGFGGLEVERLDSAPRWRLGRRASFGPDTMLAFTP